MRIILYLFIVFACSSCFLWKPYKQSSLTYASGEQSRSLPLVIPKGFKREETVADSAGNKGLVYHYSNGAVLYFVHTKQKESFQPIDEEMNVPLTHPYGKGLLYKGQDSSGLYWREVQLKDFRFGYRNVPADLELRFDSSVNFASYYKDK